jgi:hypothetical protein
VHVLLEEAIEVLYEAVAKKRRNRADLGGRKDAEQPLRKVQAGLQLAPRHCFVVFAKEGPLERSHLYPEFSCDGCEPQLHVAVRGKDEVVRNARRVLEEGCIDSVFRRRS